MKGRVLWPWLWFAGRVDRGIDHGIAHPGVLQVDDLVGRQIKASRGILDLGDDDRIADMRIHQGLNIGQRESRWRCGNGVL